MPPLPPRVVGPLSECGAAVHVLGQVTGSTVDVLADGGRIASALATGPDRFVAVPAGALRPGALITATQAFGGETSDPSPDPVMVQARPPNVPGRPRIVTHLSIGTACLWLDGMVPGATVTVRGGSGIFTATAADGTATLGVKPLIRDEILEVHQTACGVDGRPVRGSAPDPPPSPLPAPSLTGLAACATEFVVAGAVEGAHVTWTRSQGSGGAACFPLPALTVPVDPPLNEGERITVRQELPQGGPARSGDATGTVGAKLPEPVISAPICAGATSVHVTGLTPRTRIEVRQDGRGIGYAEAPAATFDIPITGLTAGKSVSLAYQSCNVFGETRRKVTVDPAPAQVGVPAVPGPLVECGATVRVTGVRQGARVQVWSARLAAPIGEAYAAATKVEVPVAPLLIAQDEITAVQLACGRTSDRSPVQPVGSLGNVSPPTVRTPLTTHATAVTVQGVVPGARVEVYVDGRWRASADAGAVTVDVPVGALRADAKVAARQAICGQTTSLGNTVTVSVPRPTVTLAASATRVLAGGQVTLKWSSTDATEWILAPDGDNLGGASGTVVKRPRQPTTYTLHVNGPGGDNQASVRVEITQPPPVTGTLNGTYRVTYSQTQPLRLQLTVTATPVSGGQPVTKDFTFDLPAAGGVIFAPQDQTVRFQITGLAPGQWRVVAKSNLVPSLVPCPATVPGTVSINANVPGVPQCGG